MARTSTYNPSFCDKVVEWGKKGYSIARCARELGISQKTYYNWRDRYGEFAEADALRSTYEEALLDDFEEAGMLGKRKLNTALFLERRRRTSGAGNCVPGKSQITIGNINIANITNDQLDTKIQELVGTLKDKYNEDVTQLLQEDVINVRPS